MSKFKLFFRKLKRLKYLSNLIKSSSVTGRLDKFWGFTYKDKKPKKVKKEKPIVKEDLKKDPLEFFDKKLVESDKEKEVLESTKAVEKSSEDDRNYEYVNEKEFFKESVKDLRKLVYPHLDPIAKRHYDEMKLLALGGKVAPNRKMPYKEFLQRQKALKRHLEKNRKLEEELGVKFTLDKKGCARFAQIHKRKDSSEKRKRKSLFDRVEKDDSRSNYNITIVNTSSNMEETDNLNCNLDDEIPESRTLDLIKDVNEIVSLLINGSGKFSKKLDVSTYLISNLIKSNEINRTEDNKDKEYESKQEKENDKDNGTNKRLEQIESGVELEVNEKPSENKPDISELLPKWQHLLNSLDGVNSELKGFTRKLNHLHMDIAKGEESDKTDNNRDTLPTEVNGTRLSPDSFMTLLRYYPVPYGENRRAEIKTIRRLILAHYENASATRFLSELQQLPKDHEIEPLISSATIRVKNTSKILLNSVYDFCTYHNNHVPFIKEYLDSLESPPDPQHNSPEYMKAFSKLISKTRTSQLSNFQSNQVDQQFKKFTKYLDSSVKHLISGISDLSIKKEKK